VSHLKSRAVPAKSISRGDRWREERMAKVEAKRAAARTRTKSSKAYSDRARRSLPGGVTANVKYFDPYPIAMRRARGCRLWDLDGNEYLVSHGRSGEEAKRGLAATSGSRGTPDHVLDNTLVLPFNDLAATEARIRGHADRLACVILEPIERSFIAPDRDFLKGLREVT